MWGFFFFTELEYTEYVKEGENKILRVVIDKADTSLTTEDCEIVSREIDGLIDELNPIKTPYSLEVSSPGIERVLRKDEHFNKYMGEEVEVSLEQFSDFTFEERESEVDGEENQFIHYQILLIHSSIVPLMASPAFWGSVSSTLIQWM